MKENVTITTEMYVLNAHNPIKVTVDHDWWPAMQVDILLPPVCNLHNKGCLVLQCTFYLVLRICMFRTKMALQHTIHGFRQQSNYMISHDLQFLNSICKKQSGDRRWCQHPPWRSAIKRRCLHQVNNYLHYWKKSSIIVISAIPNLHNWLPTRIWAQDIAEAFCQDHSQTPLPVFPCVHIAGHPSMVAQIQGTVPLNTHR